MTTIDTVKDIIGDCNYYMADVFHVVLLLQKQLDEANANDWQVGSNIPPKPIPEDAVRVGQVKVRHGDLPWEIWVRPTPQKVAEWLNHLSRAHVEHEAQWNTTCPDCGVADQLEVYTGKFSCRGMTLTGDGFDFSDAKDVDTDDERVQCTACNSEWDLAFLAL